MSALFSVGVILVSGGSTAAIATARNMIERRRARRVLRARPALGARLAEGTVVRITGIVRAHDTTLTAPLSGRSCVVYRSRLTSSWTPVFARNRVVPIDAAALTPFTIDRGAEPSVVVEGAFFTLDLPTIKRLRVDRERRDHFLLLQGVKSTARYGFDEVVVVPGDRVSVVGLMMLDPADEPPESELGFREPAPPELRLTGNREHPIVIGEPVDLA